MCATCGCDHDSSITVTKVGSEVFRAVSPEALIRNNISNREHQHIKLERDILEKNNSMAEHNRQHLREQKVFAINLVSSPGSGKTSLLEQTLLGLKNVADFFVIEGDQQTMNDANRIAATGVTAVQINTGKGCHLDADMVHRALHELDMPPGAVLFIENVGNLVCPAMFDLGENKRVAIISVTEGDDKPLKYPDMFESSDLCIINKIDLLPYVNFNVARAKEYARKVNPDLEFIELSATTGEGIDKWHYWLTRRIIP